MSIRRPNFMVVQPTKKGQLKIAYESEHKYLAEDYQRLHGGQLVVSEKLDDDGLNVPAQQEPTMTEPYISHVGRVPRPPGTYAPYIIQFGEGLEETVQVEEDTDGERIVRLPDRLLRDILDALDAADEEAP